MGSPGEGLQSRQTDMEKRDVQLQGLVQQREEETGSGRLVAAPHVQLRARRQLACRTGQLQSLG